MKWLADEMVVLEHTTTKSRSSEPKSLLWGKGTPTVRSELKESPCHDGWSRRFHRPMRLILSKVAGMTWLVTL